MVAAQRLFDAFEILVELRAIVPCRAIDPLQHAIMLVAAPVGPGHARQLKGTDRSGRAGVTAAAEIGKIADGVERDRLSVGNLASDLDLVWISREGVDRFGAGHLSPGHGVIGSHNLAHPLLEALEVVGRERLRAVEVVVETILDRRADGRFCVGEEVLDGVSKHVSGGMAQLGKRRPAIVDHRAAPSSSSPATPLQMTVGRPSG